MKKGILILICAGVLLSSCGTYTAEGAANGGYFGSLIGSMIGGITDGRRGSDIGGLVGLAGGAILGAAIGSAADRNREERIEELQRERDERLAQVLEQDNDATAYQPDGVFDPNNGGDDRITFDSTNSGVFPDEPATNSGVFSAERSTNDVLVIRHARFIDASGDGVLVAGEECTISFEIMNNSGAPVYNVTPTVYELTNNKHIHISENLRIESIMPGKGIRYTAAIKGDRKLKEGTANIRVGVMVNDQELTAQSKELAIQTRKK